jgi:hypothetical protein
VPDGCFAGYVGGPRVGAICYNVAHSHVVPLLLIAWSVLSSSASLLSVALIWLAHIGLDRALGFGLKYPTGFRDTHLGEIGRSRRI